MRDKGCDAYMEERFGKPDFTRSFIHPEDGRLWTPMGTQYKLWRVDPVFLEKEGENEG